jgi:hypothetical protein
MAADLKLALISSLTERQSIQKLPAEAEKEGPHDDARRCAADVQKHTQV